MVAGRDGLLRVLVRARSENAHSADVAVRFFHDGVLVRSETLERASEAVPTAASDADLAQSWNMLVSGDLIRPGLSIVVEADPEDRVYESDESDNVLPAGGAVVEVDVRSLPGFRVRRVPVRAVGVAGNSPSGGCGMGAGSGVGGLRGRHLAHLPSGNGYGTGSGAITCLVPRAPPSGMAPPAGPAPSPS